MNRPPIIQLPPDATFEETQIIDFAYAHLYSLIDDPMNKFIVAFMFDLGNSTQATAIATGLSRKTVWERHQKIKKMLQGLKITTKFPE